MVFCASLTREKWLLCCLEKNCVRVHRKRAFSASQLSRYTNGYGSNGEKNYDKQQVRRAAGAALRSLNWQPADNMHRALLAVASSNWGEAALLGSAAVEPLVATLQDKSDIWNLGARRAAAETLATIGDARAVEPLIAALQDQHSGVRYGAARALGTIGDARAVEPFIVALQDRNWVVRRVAAASLGKIGDARAVKPLTAALQDGEVRRAAAEAIGKIRDAQAESPS
jgi:HEAT repeat protein